MGKTAEDGIKVGYFDYKVARMPENINDNLASSCWGIAIYDPKTKIVRTQSHYATRNSSFIYKMRIKLKKFLI